MDSAGSGHHARSQAGGASSSAAEYLQVAEQIQLMDTKPKRSLADRLKAMSQSQASQAPRE